MTSDIAKAKILFVDDDQSFLDMISQAFGDFSQGAWEIQLALDAPRALEIVRRQPVDLAVLDLRMPGVDGLQLLGALNRDFPGLQKVFLTGQGDERSRLAGLESGAALFLEKPASYAGMESLFATLNELARWQQRQGERGVLRPAGLLDIVKMECKSANSRLLEVFAGAVRGQIYIKEGAIIHAISEGRRGQSALTYLVCLPGAEFHLRQFVEPSERSIDRQWESLILESARLQEQATRTAPEAKTGETLAPPVPPSLPTPASGLTTPIKLPERTAPKPPPASAPVRTAAVEAARSLAATAPATLPERAADAAGFGIEEMLVCTERREVLHEWQCLESEKRLAFLEFVAAKSRQLGEELPLGKFDRLELQSSNGRMVVHWQGNRGVLIRSNTKIQPAAAEDGSLSAPVGEWLSQQAQVRGVLACGVVQPGGGSLNQSNAPQFTPHVLEAAWRCVGETYETAQRDHFPAWQLRWLYERAQLYCARRHDGALLGVFLSKDPLAVDLAGVERLLAQFMSLRLPPG